MLLPISSSQGPFIRTSVTTCLPCLAAFCSFTLSSQVIENMKEHGIRYDDIREALKRIEHWINPLNGCSAPPLDTTRDDALSLLMSQGKMLLSLSTLQGMVLLLRLLV